MLDVNQQQKSGHQNPSASHAALVAQYTTQRLLPAVIVKILNIEYTNYSVFGKTAADDAIVREKRQAEHEAYIQNEHATATALEQAWKFAETLSGGDVWLLEQINQLLRDVMYAKPVYVGKLRRVLSAQQMETYRASLREPLHAAEILYADGVPDVLKTYNKKLRDADLVYNKFERLSNKKQNGAVTAIKNDTINKTYSQSENLYERAVLYLEEVFDVAPIQEQQEILRWLDRDVEFGYDANGQVNPDKRNVDIDNESVPRVKGSRSHNATLDAALPKMSKRLKRQQVMLQELLAAAVALAYLPEQGGQQQQDVEQQNQMLLREKIAQRKSIAQLNAAINSERD